MDPCFIHNHLTALTADAIDLQDPMLSVAWLSFNTILLVHFYSLIITVSNYLWQRTHGLSVLDFE